jgi:hypothetical protein
VGAFSYAAFAAAASGGAFAPPAPEAEDAARAWKGLFALEAAVRRDAQTCKRRRPSRADQMSFVLSSLLLSAVAW